MECYVDMTEAVRQFSSPVEAALVMKNGVHEKFRIHSERAIS